jgi:thymidylate kinase
METPARLVVIDGIAGSGKSTFVRAAVEWAREQGRRAFDLAAWSAERDDPPRFEDVSEHDVFFTFEPTRQWTGAAIRRELSRTDVPYSGTSLAHAFALDREIMYRRLVLPALAAGKTVVQERGVCTSLVYQPIMPAAPSIEEIAALPGNALALSRPPDHLILTRLDPALAVERLKDRGDESRGVFADIELLRRADERFCAEWFRDLFLSRGTILHDLSTAVPIETANASAKALISTILNTP